jgi:hypothetical protein
LAVLDFLTEGLWLETGWVDGGLVDTDLLTEGGLRLGVTGCGVDGGLVDANFFTVFGLEAGAVLTFVDIDLSLGLVFLSATGLFNLDVYLGLVLGTTVWKEIGEMGAVDVWKLNVDASRCLFDRSDEKGFKLSDCGWK